jgi:hypothetical protein
MRYRLKFIDSSERTVRELNLDADDDNAAIAYACNQSILAGLAVELCDGDRRVLRVTPMTARLYLPDRGAPRL